MWWIITLVSLIVVFFVIKIFMGIVVGAKISCKDTFVLIAGLFIFCTIGWARDLFNWIRRKKDRYEGW